MRRKDRQKSWIPVPPIGLSVLVATLMLNVLALAQPLVVLQVFDRVVPYQSTETLLFLFLGLCVVVGLEFVLRAARATLLGASGERFERDLSERFLEATLRATPDSASGATPAAKLDQFGAIAHLRGHYAGQGRILAIDLPFIAIFVAMIGLIGGWLVLVPLSCIFMLLVFTNALQRAQTAIFEERLTLDGRRYSFLVEVLTQIRTLKANTMEPQILRRYELLQKQTVDISRKIIRFSGMSQGFGALFSQFAVAAMGIFGGFLIIRGYIGIAELAACMLLNGRTVQPMMKALGLWVQSESLAMSRAKVEDALSAEVTPPGAGSAPDVKGVISLKNVAFKHPGRDTYLFHGVNLTVKPGQCLLVSGNAGAGKSSLLKLIIGDRVADVGRVLIDGRPAKACRDVRGAGGIVYIDHRPTAFAGTVLENISAFGDGERIAHALELSARLGTERFINRLPLGYNTSLLDSPALMNNRAALIGITLIRALALRPRVLLLNNVGSAMDEGTRAAFGAILAELKGATTVVISENSDAFADLADHRIHVGPDVASALAMWERDSNEEAQAPPVPQAVEGVA